MGVFESTFGIEDLHRMIKKIENARVEAEEKNQKFKLSEGDLENYILVLDEFKFRHKALSDKINQTYQLGNKMLEYLEKHVILGKYSPVKSLRFPHERSN